MKKILLCCLVLVSGAYFSCNSVYAQDTQAAKFTKHIFATTDVDKNGYITFQEARRADNTFTKQQFDAFDTNKDGQLTYQEYWAVARGFFVR